MLNSLNLKLTTLNSLTTLNKFFFCSSQNTRKERLHNILTSAFNPAHLEITNESYKHKVPKDSETHFKFIIVSEDFRKKSQVEIHKSVYKLLFDEMGEKSDNKLHSISLVTKTPEEWNELSLKEKKFRSPNCYGATE